MPLQKFKTPEEAEKALICRKPDAAYFERLARLYQLSDELSPRKYPRGIFKYRSIEEANDEAHRWEMENALRLRKERR